MEKKPNGNGNAVTITARALQTCEGCGRKTMATVMQQGSGKRVCLYCPRTG